MITLVFLLIGITFFVGLVPLLQGLFYAKEKNEQTNITYLFEKELFDADLNMLQNEAVTSDKVSVAEFRNRGSIRIAQGLVFDQNEFEKRKLSEYKIELP